MLLYGGISTSEPKHLSLTWLTNDLSEGFPRIFGSAMYLAVLFITYQSRMDL